MPAWLTEGQGDDFGTTPKSQQLHAYWTAHFSVGCSPPARIFGPASTEDCNPLSKLIAIVLICAWHILICVSLNQRCLADLMRKISSCPVILDARKQITEDVLDVLGCIGMNCWNIIYFWDVLLSQYIIDILDVLWCSMQDIVMYCQMYCISKVGSAYSAYYVFNILDFAYFAYFAYFLRIMRILAEIRKGREDCEVFAYFAYFFAYFLAYFWCILLILRF